MLRDDSRHRLHQVGVGTTEAIDGLLVVTDPHRAIHNLGEAVEDVHLYG